MEREILKCDNCGAPVKDLHSTKCRYCGSVFVERSEEEGLDGLTITSGAMVFDNCASGNVLLIS